MKVVSVTSFKGGTAKTSTALHIGAALCRYHGKKVLLVDFDSQANLTLGLGFDPDSCDSLAPVFLGEKNVSDVLKKTAIEGLDLIPGDTWLERVEVRGSLASDRYSHERLKKILQGFDYDYVFIDTPPSLCWLTESALIASQYSLVCATPEFYSIKGLERLSEFISTVSQRHPLDVLGVIISFWNARGKSNKAFLKVIERAFPNKCFENKVRRDATVSEAALWGKPLFEIPKLLTRSRAAEDFRLLADEIVAKVKKAK